MKYELERLRLRLQELEAWRDLEGAPLLAQWGQQGTWQTVEEGQAWPNQDFPAHFTFEGEVPKHWQNQPVWVRLRVGGEALLLVDGQTVGGLNPFHTEYPMLSSAKGGEVLALEVEAVPKGLFGVPNPNPHLQEARLLVPDLQVRSLCTDLECVLQAAQEVTPEVSELLVDLLGRCFAQIQLPRSPAEGYLNQLQRSSWQQMNAQIWEGWKFEGAGLALQAPHRQSLTLAQQTLAQGLAQIAQRYPSVGELWLSGHAHIDLAWLWPIAETRRKIRRTFASVLQLMQDFPQLYFNQSSAQAYAWLEQDDPRLFEQVQARVKEGRWEVVGGMWVEPDGQLLSGESWVRQLLYGQRYFEAKFGQRAKVAWLPDTFGFAANLPQLFQQAELPYFFTTKMNWNETEPFPHDLWQWEGLDGSKVLAHGFWNPNESYNGHLEAKDLAGTWKNFRGKRHHPASLLTFGYGDGGGGPSEPMLQRQSRFEAFPGLPKTQIGRMETYYQNLEAKAAELPVWQGEMYLQLHRATFTTQAHTKALHRQLEQTLYQAEAAWSLVALRGLQALTLDAAVYPAGELEALWKTLLLHQFHDILPGSSIHTVAHQGVQALQTALDAAQALLREAAGLLSHDLRSVHPLAKGHLTVWNFSSQPQPLCVAMPRPLERFFRLLDSSGEEVVYQEAGAEILLCAPQTVPAFGYTSLAVVTELEARKPAEHSVVGTANLLENQYLRVEVGPDGTLTSLFDKTHGREALEGRGNQIWSYTDIPRYWEAWDVDASHAQEGQEVLATQVRLVETGPLRAGIWVERRIGGSRMEQVYWLWAGSRRLEIETTVHWQERRTFLRALFPLQVRSSQAWFETAFGALSRPTHRNTRWEAAQFEVPSLRFADLSEPGFGVSLLNDGKYGHSAKDNVLGLSLLRGAIWPDPYADVDTHRFRYALFPHGGDWRSETLSQADAISIPLVPVVLHNPDGTQPIEQSHIGIDTPALRISALKRSEEGKGYILRLYEATGARGVATVDLGRLRIARVRQANVLEDIGDPLSLEGGRLRLAFSPHQVISLRLEQ